MIASTDYHWVFNHWFKVLKTSHLYMTSSIWYYLTVISFSEVLSLSVSLRLCFHCLSNIYLTVISYLSDIFNDNLIDWCHFLVSFVWFTVDIISLFIHIYLISLYIAFIQSSHSLSVSHQFNKVFNRHSNRL